MDLKSTTKNLAAMGAHLAACRLAEYGDCAPRTQSAAHPRPRYLSGQEKTPDPFYISQQKLFGEPQRSNYSLNLNILFFQVITCKSSKRIFPGSSFFTFSQHTQTFNLKRLNFSYSSMLVVSLPVGWSRVEQNFTSLSRW
jgi:hypothetical protein